MKEAMEENESVHKCLNVSQKAILSLELYSSGLSKQVKELREQVERDHQLIFNMLRRMGEMEMRMNLLQVQNVSWIPLVDLTVPEVPDILGSPIRMLSPLGIRWSQRASVTPQIGEASLRTVEEMAQEWVHSEDGSPELS